MIPVKTPTEAANVITTYTLPLELRIPRVVNPKSFIANTRRILVRREIVGIKFADAKRDEYKGIWVTL